MARGRALSSGRRCSRAAREAVRAAASQNRVMVHLGEPQIQQRIFQRIAALRPESAPRWGKMSAHQMLCHLSDSFRVTLGTKPVSNATGIPQRTVVKWLALYLPAPWPKGLPTRPEVEQGAGGTPPADFQRDRAGLIELIEHFVEPRRVSPRSPHPIFGQMSEREWLRWAYLHSDHHLRQFGV
jgi:uncharacterized protein DUF1569